MSTSTTTHSSSTSDSARSPTPLQPASTAMDISETWLTHFNSHLQSIQSLSRSESPDQATSNTPSSSGDKPENEVTGIRTLVADSFLPHGWLRDVLVFTWNNRSLSGHEKIGDYLAASPAVAARPPPPQDTTRLSHLSYANISNLRLDDQHPGMQPSFQPRPAPPGIAGAGETQFGNVSFGVVFETRVGVGRGYVQLMPDVSSADGPGWKWKALCVTVMLDKLNDPAPRVASSALDVLIVGGGQTGLNIAARFKTLGLRTLVIESNERVGDNWRKRYPSLKLHTPKLHHSMLFKPYPASWPVYTARDELADWLEGYAKSMELDIWTDTALPCIVEEQAQPPVYDADKKRWTVTIRRQGVSTTLYPSHIVIATGTLGAPYIPPVHRDTFKGIALHSSQYRGAMALWNSMLHYPGFKIIGQGKLAKLKRPLKVVVVGSGNSAADIVVDMHRFFTQGVGGIELTLVQRSSTSIVPISVARRNLETFWPKNEDVDVCDFKFAATPLLLLRALAEMASAAGPEDEEERRMREELRSVGFESGEGKTAGVAGLFKIFERFGGYWLDVGCADLIISGQINLKKGVEIRAIHEWSVDFTDGSSLEADVIVFATGFENVRESVREWLGNEIVDKTGTVWGLDEEGELRGCYRPSGHPGLWYGAGDFYASRFASKQLALLIKASLGGL